MLESFARLLSTPALTVGGLWLAVSISCATPIAVEAPTVEGADDQLATCKVAKDPMNPLVVEWPGTAKVDLEAGFKQSLVIVSYQGCTLKVLNGCAAKGRYKFVDTTPTRDTMAISTNTDLYARLPLGAASLKGELESGSALKLDYVAVGQHVVTAAPSSVAGDCEGATHYVRAITVGAYSLDVVAGTAAGAEASIGNAGVGVNRKEEVRRLRGAGDVDRCLTRVAKGECGGVLQLGLAPLETSFASEPATATRPSSDDRNAVAMIKAAKEGYRLRESAMQRFNAGDAGGCLAALDRADKIDPDAAEEGFALGTRYMCELLGGKCAQGKARMKAWFTRWGGPNKTTPAHLAYLAELHSKGRCK